VRAALVGATGAVGTQMLSIIEERNVAIDELVPVASPRSAGRKLPFRGGEIEVKALAPEVFDGVGIAFFDVPDEVSREWAPIAVEAGAIVVDKSGAWRMDPDVPLVVPEVNPTAVGDRRKGIIANPNCTTLAMVVPLAPLHVRFEVTRLVVASYQAASGAGMPGIEELWDQTQAAVKQPDEVREGRARDVLDAGETFGHPIALNAIPHCGSVKDDGYTSEELKLLYETRKIMSLPELQVSATCVRVPVMVGHGVAVHAEFAAPVSVEQAREILAAAPGVVVQDDLAAGVYPTPLGAAGTDPCYVGRIRQNMFDDKALEFFSVTDNLRKGAALNTVQVAELLLDS